jgi:hypothetical protein
MIVRVMADGQYRIDDETGNETVHTEIDQLDSTLQGAIEANDEAAFHDTLSTLIEKVHRLGQPVSETELVTSDVIVPPADMTVAETKYLLFLPAGSER